MTAGFRNLDSSSGTIAKCLESLSLDDFGAQEHPDLIALAVTGKSYSDARIAEIAHALPEGQTLWAFSPTPRNITHAKLKVTHVPASTDREFVGKVCRHLERFVKSLPIGGPLNPERPTFPATRVLYDSYAEYVPLVGERHVASVAMDGVPFEFLADFRPHSKKLVVMGQDAITRSKIKLPHFFRWKWAPQINASVMFWSDPTLHLDDSLDGAWWIGSAERDYVVEAVGIVERIMQSLDLRTEDVLFVGMSAGGFSALQMASALEGSRALVDIPRVTLRAHGTKGETANQAVRSCLQFEDAMSVPPSHLHRIEVLERIRNTGVLPKFQYFQNLRDLAHLDSQYRPFREAVERHPNFDPEDQVFREYSQWHLAKGGHFPVKESSMVREINAMLDSD